MKTKPILVGAILIALTFVGCKPTERNYQAAYDAALQKREAARAEDNLPATGLLSDDGPQLRVLDGDTVYVLRETLRQADGKRIAGRWSVAVGEYRMDTNAKANAEALRSQGWPDAFTAKATGGRWYTLLRSVSTLDSARNISVGFRGAHPGYPYVGLPSSPVIIGY